MSLPAPMTTLRFRLIDPRVEPGWDDFVRDGGGGIFHSSAWARVLCAAYSHTPAYLVLSSGGRPEAALPVMDVRSWPLPRRGVSLPFSDYCEPLLPDGRAADGLFETLLQWGRRRGWRRLELRGAEGLGLNGPPSARYYGHDVPLDGGETRLWEGLSGATRRNIRRAGDQGVTVRFEQTLDAMRRFYALNVLTRRRHGLPPQPWGFFRQLHHHLIGPGAGRVVTADYRGRTIAGSVFLHFGRRAHYKYGASDLRFQSLRANNLVMWEAMRRYAEEGVRGLCLGRTDLPNEGLRRFKRGWGARERLIEYHTYDLRAAAFTAPRPAVSNLSAAVFRRLPPPLLRLAGTMIYRYAA